MWELEVEYAGESDDSSVIFIVILTANYITDAEKNATKKQRSHLFLFPS